MSVYNSVHNTPVNSYREDDVQDLDPVTRISKLYISDPLHLHPNDTTALTVVSIKLKGTKNYQVYSILSRETLPDVRSACATISSKESHRVVVGSIAGSSQRNQASAFDLTCEKCFEVGDHVKDYTTMITKIPNDDERVANDLNKGKSDSSSSSVSGSNINTADFPVDYGNDADSSDEFVATQNEEIDAMNQEMDVLLRNGTW
ncbi:hypothetical protein Tco_0446510 [Tanacetum coccineum]